MDKPSLTDIRNKNRSDIYALIYREGRASKSQIVASLGLSLPTVTQHLSDLTDEGLVEQRGQLASTIGRKAAAYAVCGTKRVAVGLEVLSDKITVVVTDLYAQPLMKDVISRSFSLNEEYFVELSHTVRGILEAGSYAESDVLGIGVGIQGLVSPDGARVTYGKILNCTGAEIEPMANLFACPVRFLHDSECAADMELWKNPGVRNAFYISLSANLGCAVIRNGRISHGRMGRAGTIEHMTLDRNGRVCYCGKRGCMECYCSVNALLEPGERLQDFMEAVRAGASEAQTRWDGYLDWLALALKDLYMVLDCQVILGGHLAPYLTREDLDVLFEKVRALSPFPEDENFLITGIQDKYAIASGAALPFIREFLASV